MNDETADGNRVIVGPDGRSARGTFPRNWGVPPVDLEERTRWIEQHIREGDRRMDAGDRVEGQRPKTGRQAIAALNRKRGGVADANRVRLQMLERNQLGPQ